jgi:hypothetical protein
MRIPTLQRFFADRGETLVETQQVATHKRKKESG